MLKTTSRFILEKRDCIESIAFFHSVRPEARKMIDRLSGFIFEFELEITFLCNFQRILKGARIGRKSLAHHFAWFETELGGNEGFRSFKIKRSSQWNALKNLLRFGKGRIEIKAFTRANELHSHAGSDLGKPLIDRILLWNSIIDHLEVKIGSEPVLEPIDCLYGLVLVAI